MKTLERLITTGHEVDQKMSLLDYLYSKDYCKTKRILTKCEA